VYFATTNGSGHAGGRWPGLDIARTLALVAMGIFHLIWDLTMFGVLPPQTSRSVVMRLSAQIIAGSFLFLSGVSLWLAHRDGIRWRPFLRRLALLCMAALAVSLATRIAMPQAWVRFGILHAIALSTLIGLAFLRAPLAILGGVALFVLAVGQLRLAAFDGPLWIWTGLGRQRPWMLDYEPIFPWLGICLLGLLAARLFLRDRVAAGSPGRLTTVLSWPGRHSLAIYLIHQPILFALAYLASLMS
jgi:uncharacterized membrane protein